VGLSGLRVDLFFDYHELGPEFLGNRRFLDPTAHLGLPAYDPAKLRDGEISATRHRNVAHWFAFAGLAAAWGGLLLRRW
jgi:hypothetical protein